MALPEAVVKQEEEAQAIFNQMYGTKDTDGKDTPAPPEGGEAPEGSATDEAKPEKVEGKPTEDGEAAQPITKEEAPADADARLKADYEKLLHSHEVLKGKYNAEVPRSAEQLRASEQRIRELEAKIAALEVRGVEPKKTKDEPAREDHTKRLAAIEADFGKDAAGNINQLIEDRAREIANEAIKAVRGEVEGLGKTVARTREERFLSDLTSLNKSWRETYKSPEFASMLGETEPFTGKTYGDLAQEANDAMDPQRLAKIYNLFDSRNVPAEKVAAPEVKKEVRSKEELIAPSGSPKAAAPSGDKPEYIKTSDIERYYQESALGRWNDRPKEKAEMESRINRAISNRWVIEG